MNTLIHEYKFFRMKPKENIEDIEKHFIRIMNHIITLGEVFQNER